MANKQISQLTAKPTAVATTDQLAIDDNSSDSWKITVAQLITLLDTLYLTLSGGTMTGAITLPGDPTSALEAATKQYVDALAAGFEFHESCVCATTANLTAVYSNGTAGVGATLVNSGAMAAFSSDGVSPSLNDRVLVKNQTNTFENGIYVLTTVGDGATNWVLTRATDYDTITEIVPGDFVTIDQGTLYAVTSWIQTATVATIGTDPIVWDQFSANPEDFLTKANNLSDVTNQVTASSNLYPQTIVTGTSDDLENNASFVANNAALVTLTLPATAAIGTRINIVGLGAGGWKIAQNASQQIHSPGASTTAGTGGAIDSTTQYDCLELECVVADTTWVVRSGMGSPTYT